MQTVIAKARSLSQAGRVVTAVGVNAVLLGVIGHAFWLADWRYSLPTPRPAGLQQPPTGSRPSLPPALAGMRRGSRPLLINFANPHCPCTEFNLDHLRKLQQRYSGTVDFVTILESSADGTGAQREFQSMHLPMPMVYDPKGEVSASLGVYGTPQAVLLDGTGQLYFRGNYNRSRYCAEESSEFARIALDALANGRALPALPAVATIAYGCSLPRKPRPLAQAGTGGVGGGNLP